MKNPTILRTLAALMVLTGLWLTATTLRSTPKRLKQLERKTTDVRTLQEFQRALSDDHDAIKAYNQLETHTLPSIDVLLKEAFPDHAPRMKEDNRRDIAGGWYVRRVSITLEEVALERLGAFLERAESARPPWKVRSCDITSAPGQEGFGRVHLSLEGLEKGS